MNRSIFFALFLLLLFSCRSSLRPTATAAWEPLLQMRAAPNWDIFIGAPHATVRNLEGVDPQSDGKNAAPLGLNHDPKQVFSFEKENGDPVLHISGEIYGALTSKETYENYHLRLQYKWGEKKWEPRLDRPRDSGILYHCHGPHARFWNVWMSSQEFQVQEGDVGDFYALVATLMSVPAEKEGREFNYKKGAALAEFSNADKSLPIHCNKGFNNEHPHGQWNTLELICLNGNSLHIVNGKVVMALYNSRYQNDREEVVPLTKGKIQIQSEGAEIFYKNIEIRRITAIPSDYTDQL